MADTAAKSKDNVKDVKVATETVDETVDEKGEPEVDMSAGTEAAVEPDLALRMGKVLGKLEKDNVDLHNKYLHRLETLVLEAEGDVEQLGL